MSFSTSTFLSGVGRHSIQLISGRECARKVSRYVQLKAGDAVVFNSATSGLSQWLIALAKERGIRTIGLVRKASDVETVKQRGCDVVIVDDKPLEEATKKLQGLNIPLGLDVIGGPSAGRVLQILTPGGKLVVYGGVSLKPSELSNLALIQKRLTVEVYFQTYPDLKPLSGRLPSTLGRTARCNLSLLLHS